MSYSTVAVKAAKLAAGKEINPVDAWKRCVEIEYPESPSSQKKGCPKNAFLGLCEAGKINGIAPGKYCRSEYNKAYALAAVEILFNGKNSVFTSMELWNEVLKKLKADINKRHNCQMDVVLALWENGLIENLPG